jgi:hypothetical protein
VLDAQRTMAAPNAQRTMAVPDAQRTLATSTRRDAA